MDNSFLTQVRNSLAPEIVRLEITCPGAFKKENKCSVETLSWCWVKCGHWTMIDDEGFTQCSLCKFKHFIQNVAFKCRDLNHGTKYESFSSSNLMVALSWAAQSVD